MDRLTRHQLKQDDFKVSFDHLEDYFKQHFREIFTTVIAVAVVAGLALGGKFYMDKQEASANADLAAALRTFHASVGATSPELGAGQDNYPTAEAKYKRALDQFNAIVQKYQMFPRPKAVAIARYHAGVCQSLLGDQTAAVWTLEEAGRDRDREVAALAKFALAGEYVKAGKAQEAAKLYQDLADHPTVSVPRATAMLALADSYRATQPARARQIYDQMTKEYAADPTVAQAIKQEMAGLTQ